MIIHWPLHRVWLGLFASGLVLGFLASPACDYLTAHLQARNADLSKQVIKLTSDIKQLQSDAEQAEQLGKTMSADDARRQLAPADRLTASSLVEQQAAANDLAQLSYAFAPAQILDIPNSNVPSVLTESVLTLQADAPDDRTVYNFIAGLMRVLPGKASLQNLQITRDTKNMLGATNLHLTAKMNWLANGKNPTEAP